MLEFEPTPEEVEKARRAEVAAQAPSPSIEVASPGPVALATPSAPPSPPEPRPAPGPKRPAFLRWVLAVALIPLAMSITKKDDVKERFAATIEHNPEALEHVTKEMSREDVLDLLPGHRIEGAYAAEDSKIHWIFALLAAAAFWGFLHFAYPRGNATPGGLWGVGAFTGTVGIFLLLAVQWCAAFSGGTRIWGRGIVAIVMFLLKFIGFSYNAALNPENGFLLSMFGFTFGVGLCEELAKALPLLWSFRRGRQLPGRLAAAALLDLNGAVTWGLAAGIGFGVSEGIHYAGGMYNGISTGGIYVVRFVSCVALHAVWSGASACLIWEKQHELDEADNLYGWILPVLKLLSVSMVLHGLYDTLLKRDMELPALLVAIASFGWFFWLYRRAEGIEAKEQGLAV